MEPNDIAYQQHRRQHEHLTSVLTIRNIRLIFATLSKNPDVTSQSYLPKLGMNVGQFAVWRVIQEQKKTR